MQLHEVAVLTTMLPDDRLRIALVSCSQDLDQIVAPWLAAVPA